jgi:hypothetical protein
VAERERHRARERRRHRLGVRAHEEAARRPVDEHERRHVDGGVCLARVSDDEAGVARDVRRRHDRLCKQHDDLDVRRHGVSDTRGGHQVAPKSGNRMVAGDTRRW